MKGANRNQYYTKFDRREYIQIAKELCYSKEVIKKLEQAEDDNTCSRIMQDARKGVI